MKDRTQKACNISEMTISGMNKAIAFNWECHNIAAEFLSGFY